ncbi:MAG: TetR/AcrR family transcriptional regulator [Saprospiraceae bacterium]|nr:TetR/AcrR family transcriptional regulator [Saprospiraceae bacterium]
MNYKEEILNKTFGLVMKYGIKSVSMDDISRSIGISKKTIYQYFENKRALIAAVIDDHIEKDEEDIRKITTQSANAIDEIIDIARHLLSFLKVMSPSMIYDTQKYYPKQWEKVESQHFSFFYNIIKTNIERGQREGLYINDINPGIISRLYVKQTLAITDESTFPINEYKRDELYKTLITYHIRGMLTELGRNKAQLEEIK